MDMVHWLIDLDAPIIKNAFKIWKTNQVYIWPFYVHTQFGGKSFFYGLCKKINNVSWIAILEHQKALNMSFSRFFVQTYNM
jgi:hypothetical protein